MSIADIRLELVEMRAQLRSAKSDIEQSEALLSAGIGGKNAEERKHNTVLALASSEAHCSYLEIHAQLTYRIEQLEARLENARDARREHEWAIRERLVLALERQAAAQDEADAFEAAADDLADAAFESAHGSYNGKTTAFPWPKVTVSAADDLPF